MQTKLPLKQPTASNGRLQGRLNNTFRSLRVRNFRLYYIGQTISNSGNWLTNVALTLLILKITRSGLDVGLLAVAQYGPVLLLSAYGGLIADRYDKRRMLVITQSLEMAESVGLAITAFQPHPSLAILFTLAVAGGTFLAFDNPIRRSFVSEMVGGEDVSNAIILYSTLVNISRIVGPAVAGLLVVSVGYGWCFTIDALSYVAVITSLLLMRANELHKFERATKQKGEIRHGLNYVLKHPQLWISFTMLAIIGVLAYNFTVTLPLFVSIGLHRTNATYAILYSVMGVGSIFSALSVAHRNSTRLKHIIVGAAGLGASMLLLAVSPSLIYAIPAVFLIGVTSILYSTSTTALAQIESTPQVRGRVLALQTMLLMGTTPIGGPLLGWLADHYGGRLPLVIGAIASIAAAVFGYIAVSGTIGTLGKSRQ